MAEKQKYSKDKVNDGKLCHHSSCRRRSGEPFELVPGSLFCSKHVCASQGCVSRRVFGCFCKRHAASMPRCEAPGCTNVSAPNKSYCILHQKYLKRTCSECNETALIDSEGTPYCDVHAPRPSTLVCPVVNCNRDALYPSEFCIDHSFLETCARPACDVEVERGSRFCFKHKCIVDGCSKKSQSKRLCIRHGGGKLCLVGQCKNLAKHPSPTCVEHGGGVPCKHSGCKRFRENTDGYCQTHGNHRPKCKVPGCNKHRQSNGKGMCTKHAKEDIDESG